MPYGERELSDYWVKLRLSDGRIKQPALDTHLLAGDVGEQGTKATSLILTIHHLEAHPPRRGRKTPELKAQIAESERQIGELKGTLRRHFGIDYDVLEAAAKDARIEDL